MPDTTTGSPDPQVVVILSTKNSIEADPGDTNNGFIYFLNILYNLVILVKVGSCGHYEKMRLKIISITIHI